MIDPSRGSKTYFYNAFISAILFGEDQGNTSVITECVETLDRIAFVSIEMTRADAIVYTKVEDLPVDIPTVAGGLLSLYMGVSFLSMVEVAAIVIQLCFGFIKTLVPSFKY